MTQQEELRVVLRTIAETAGATQTQTALRQVSTQTDQTNASLRRTSQTAREIGNGFRVGAEDILRFAGALTGIEIGLSLFASAGRALRDSITGAIEVQAQAERVTRATAASYGAAADQFERFATSLSSATGFTRTAILEAALSARTLSDNYGLTIQQTQRLISVSADLARVRGIGVAEAFERVQSAIRGEAEASEFLGLTLNATFLQNNAANGSLRQTFTTLTDAQRAQVVYNEVLRQTEKFQGLAATATGQLDQAMANANVSGQNLSQTLGKLIEPAVISSLQAASQETSALEEHLKQVIVLRDALKFGIGQPAPGATPTVPQAIPIGGAIPTNVAKGLADVARDVAGALPPATTATNQFGLTFRIVDETLQHTHATLSQISQDINDLSGRSSALSTILNALSPNDIQGRTTVGAQQDLQRIDAQINAQKSLLAIEQEIRREQEATKITDPRDVAGANQARQRLQVLQQLLPAEQALTEAQRARGELQNQATQLSGVQAGIELTILPQRQRIAEIEREIADSVNRQVQLRQEQNLLLVQQAALTPNNALDDTQAQIQRDRLVLANRRGTSAEERTAARREIRDLTRNVLPGQELSAFDANRQVAVAERNQRATDIGTRLHQNVLEQSAQVIRDSIKDTERQIQIVQQQSEQISLLTRVADAVVSARQQAVQVVIDGAVEVLGAGGGTLDGAQQIAANVAQQVFNNVFGQLKEGLGQAQFPALIPQSGVRHQ